MSGVRAGLKEALREGIDDCPVVSLDGDGQFKTSLERVRRHLRVSKARRVLVGAANDASALGAARAFQEAGRAGTCAIVGQNAEPDARAELREPRSPLVASIGFFPERYGDGLIRLALDILAHRQVAAGRLHSTPAHHAENVDHFYPNDALLGHVLDRRVAAQAAFVTQDVTTEATATVSAHRHRLPPERPYKRCI